LALVDNMLHYFDRTSMAHSLEVRVPFLDHEVVEYCAQIPSALKVRRLTTKYVLRRAARGLVPDDIIDKRKLGFFRGASSGWLKAQMEASVREYLLAPDARTEEFLDRRVVERMLHDHASGRDTSKVYLLLALLLLEVWLTTYAERALPTSPSNAEVAA
jgi:asparagine synthase (glutamine-hydrolysing)